MAAIAHDSYPPGWYADGRGLLRWWDGHEWSVETMSAPPDANPARSDFSAFDLRLALLRPADAPQARRRR